MGFRVEGLGFGFGYCPHPGQSILGVLLRAIYNHIRSIIQLLLRGGYPRFGVKGLRFGFPFEGDISGLGFPKVRGTVLGGSYNGEYNL